MPVISVIIPVYNVEQYLRRCVESVLHQSFADMEVILINDGSSDRSGAICDEYAQKDTRVRVIHQKNQGSSAARNNGIRIAEGEYLFFVDSDDAIHPDCLKVLYENVIQNDTAISMAAFERFSEQEAPIKPYNAIASEVKSGIDVLAMFFDDRHLQKYALASACCKLFKRELFKEIAFPPGRLFEDQAITYKLFFMAKNVSIVNATYYYYYTNPEGNMGKLTTQKMFDEHDVQWERLVFLKENQLTELYKKALLDFLWTTRWTLVECQKEETKVDPKRKRVLEKRYETVFDNAKARGLLDFRRDYDYFVLAKPKKVFWWRIKRLLTKRKR